MRERKVAAIIVAGGQGTRFGGSVRKQYLRLGGRPVLWWSLRAFQSSPSVQWISLVVPDGDTGRIERQARSWCFTKIKSIIVGGPSRRASVACGLQTLPAAYAWVTVHDAVRPLVTRALIEATIIQAQRTGAAIAACRSKDTVKMATPDSFIERTPPRERLWLAQTPQTFRRTLLEKAHRAHSDMAATDDAQLVELLGARVKLVESPAENLKITTPIDLSMAGALLAGRKGRRA